MCPVSSCSLSEDMLTGRRSACLLDSLTDRRGFNLSETVVSFVLPNDVSCQAQICLWTRYHLSYAVSEFGPLISWNGTSLHVEPSYSRTLKRPFH